MPTGGKVNAHGSTVESGSKGSPTDATLSAIANLERQAYATRSFVDHVASWITKKAGSGTTIIVHIFWFAIWLLINLDLVPDVPVFDPFPFNLLTMTVSLEAIFLTLFVLISQNTMSREGDKRAELDLQVNLLAERETTMILEMLQRISEKLGVTETRREDLVQLLKETRIEDLAVKLDQALSSNK